MPQPTFHVTIEVDRAAKSSSLSVTLDSAPVVLYSYTCGTFLSDARPQPQTLSLWDFDRVLGQIEAWAAYAQLGCPRPTVTWTGDRIVYDYAEDRVTTAATIYGCPIRMAWDRSQLPTSTVTIDPRPAFRMPWSSFQDFLDIHRRFYREARAKDPRNPE